MPDILVDLSSNNHGPAHFDWNAAKASGVIGAFIKATDGEGYVNPYYASDLADALAAGVPVLAYHFAQFGDPQREATHFINAAGERARVLDSETNSDVAWHNAFLAALNLPANEELDYGSASTLPRTGVRSLLWVASYGRDWGFGDAWQFTDAENVPGIGTCDASVWIGSQADFGSLFLLSPAPAPDPDPEPPEPTEDIMTGVSFSVTTTNDSTRHRASIVYPGWPCHEWVDKDGPKAGVWQSENLAAKARDAQGFPFPTDVVFNGNQVPAVQEINGYLIIAVKEGPGGRDFEFYQNPGSAEWGYSVTSVLPPV